MTKITGNEVAALLTPDGGGGWDVNVAASLIRSGRITASEVSRLVGVSREAVRSRLVTHGMAGVVSEGREARLEARKQARLDARARQTITGAKNRRFKVPTEQILDDIRRVDERRKREMPHIDYLSHATYTRLKKPGEVSAATAMKRFEGSWRQLCIAAGVQPGITNRPSYSRTTDEEKVEWVQRCITMLREEADDPYLYVTAAMYDEWSKDRKSRPSLATLRLFGVHWEDLHREALRRIYADAE